MSKTPRNLDDWTKWKDTADKAIIGDVIVKIDERTPTVFTANHNISDLSEES